MFFRSIHGLRGVAAMMVVFYHYGLIFYTLRANGIGEVPAVLEIGSIKTFGASGVPIFFVISGFVIGMQRLKTGFGAMGDFALKRSIRLVPLYWLMTMVMSLLLQTIPSEYSIIGSLFFVQLLRGDLPIIQPGWSLEYEMFFYAMFGAFVVSGICATRVRGVVALSFVFLAIFVAHWMYPHSKFLFVYGSPLIFEFLLGLLLSCCYDRPIVRKLWRVSLVAAVSLFSISCVSGLSAGLTQALWAGGAFFVVMGLVGSEISGRPLLKGVVWRELGDASYAIYLSHTVLVFSLFVWPLWHWKLQQYIEPHLTLIILSLVAATTGWLLHTLCEAPMTKALRNWTLRRSATILLP